MQETALAADYLTLKGPWGMDGDLTRGPLPGGSVVFDGMEFIIAERNLGKEALRVGSRTPARLDQVRAIFGCLVAN